MCAREILEIYAIKIYNIQTQKLEWCFKTNMSTPSGIIIIITKRRDNENKTEERNDYGYNKTNVKTPVLNDTE